VTAATDTGPGIQHPYGMLATRSCNQVLLGRDSANTLHLMAVYERVENEARLLVKALAYAERR
jgi:hypothetical protein